MSINLSIKDVPDDVAGRLRARAARNHRALQGAAAVHHRAGGGTGTAAFGPLPHGGVRPARHEEHRADCRGSQAPLFRATAARPALRGPHPAGPRLAMTAPMRSLHVAEPAAPYRVFRPVVADSSAICALLFEEAERDEAHQQLQGCELHAPALLELEFASVALKNASPGRAGAGHRVGAGRLPRAVSGAAPRRHRRAVRAGATVRAVGLRCGLPLARRRAENDAPHLRPQARRGCRGALDRAAVNEIP